tara:strand:- start:1247 stop:2026 length:780 start_codon:yes stop_codon:yes gene_type:complete
MSKNKHLTIVEKAWQYTDRESDYPNKHGITRGTTLGKAKYSLFLELSDTGWLDSFMDIFNDFSFRRAPEEDNVRMPAAPVLEKLTKEQRHIIGHANGNSDREPGWRDYYCTSDGDQDCEHLVELGLMKHGRILDTANTSRYYLLTEEGALAALSDAVISREKAEGIIKPWVPSPVENGMLGLESIKENPELKDRFKNMKCRIYSWEWGYYWRMNGCGYASKDDAGIYSFEDAYDRTNHCGSEKGIWYEIIEEEAQEQAA